MKSKYYTVKFRFWIDSDDGPFLGSGRIQLLENIKKTGSITNASKLMGMSYRNAWELVNSINSKSNKPLVTKIIGGKNGSGAILTDEGEVMIKKFYEIQNDIINYINFKYNHLKL